MGLLDLFRGVDDVSYTRFMPRETEFGSFESMFNDFMLNWDRGGLIEVGKDGEGYLQSAYADLANLSPARMYATQPQLQAVVKFVARNLAQLGLHTFLRIDENNRQRDRECAFAKSMYLPDTDTTEYDLKFALVVDFLLYDVAYWWILPHQERPGAFRIRRLPPAWVEPHGTDPWTRDHYVVDGGNGKAMKIPASEVVVFHGYSADRPGDPSPTLRALRQILVEQMYAMEHRNQVWRRGARASAYIARPETAPKWSQEARDRFKEDWRNIERGGVGVLEDGMKLERTDFSSREMDFVDAAKLSLSQVCSAFHVNPTMLGQNEGSSYSNVREFRRMLYGDTLGPLISQLEDRINHVVLPMMGMDDTRWYVEFNIQEKMQGSFEEQTQALQASTGVPWMTRNEARALQNLPALEGGDDLITPLNVLVGGQASPQDSGSQNERLGDPVNPPSAFD